MNEAETKAEHIDPVLKAAGWGVVEGSRIRCEYSIAPGRIEGHGRRAYSDSWHSRARMSGLNMWPTGPAPFPESAVC